MVEDLGPEFQWLEDAVFRLLSPYANLTPVLTAVVRRAIGYVHVDRELNEIVFDARALYLGLLSVGQDGAENVRYGNTANWFREWLERQLRGTSISRVLGDSPRPNQGMLAELRDFPVVFSIAVHRLIKPAALIARQTIAATVFDTRHLFAAMIKAGLIADQTRDLTGVDISGPLLDDLKVRFIDRVMEAPGQGESRAAWERVLLDKEQGGAPPPPDLEFFNDAPELEDDTLDRGGLAIVVARRLHAIWCDLNDGGRSRSGAQNAAFVMHLDAPWGGGKTTFANFVARVLNPYGFGGAPARFLAQRNVLGANLSGVFVADPLAPDRDGPTQKAPSADARRPWIVVEFNAWRMQHCSPPWWAFYQVLRKACFTAIRREGDEPADIGPDGPRPPLPMEDRLVRWGWLWVCEIWWRLWTPSLILPFVAFLTTAVVMAALEYSGALYRSEGHGVATDLKDAAGWLLPAFGGLTLVGGAVSLFLQSMTPGLDPLAERLGLGRADPLERFRLHFERSMRRVRRPVLVVVDDIDRCSPEVIVDLVRGMQTILRSPRIVFLILGDREWIERAFEARNKDMGEISGSEEQSLGARFVEKAIQMSLLLPGLAAEAQTEYVRGLLNRRRGSRQSAEGDAEASVAAEAAAQEASVRLRERVRKVAAEDAAAAFNAQSLRDTALQEWQAAKDYLREAKEVLRTVWRAESAEGGPEPDEKALEDEARRLVRSVINDELAIQAVSTSLTEAETARRLLPLAPWLPSNPRQIKRILNGIALYHSAALQHHRYDTAGDGFLRLAIWIVIMTEWPLTWRLLAASPALADILANPDPNALQALHETELPGSREATSAEVARMRADPDVMALITGQSRSGPDLDTIAVRNLVELTPPHTRRPRIARPKLSSGAS